MSLPLNLLLVDDHALFREGLVRLLENERDLRVIGKCGNGRDALDLLMSKHPDVVLLDFDLGGEQGLDFIKASRLSGFTGKILIVTAGVSDEEAVQLIQAGVAGIFHKTNPPELLCGCIRQVAAGEPWLERDYLRPLFRTVDPKHSAEQASLTDRERSVLRCVFEGCANKEIAAQLQLSETSVKGILQQLFHKTGVRTRTQLVRIALERYRDQLQVRAGSE
jgi:DNA-binding NarL/FixJ family response regulator